MDRNQENKELDSMTDKVNEKEMKVSGAGLKNLSETGQAKQITELIEPDDEDIELLQKELVSAQHSMFNLEFQGSTKHDIIDAYTKHDEDFEKTVSTLLRIF